MFNNPCPNINSTTIEFMAWMSNNTPIILHGCNYNIYICVCTCMYVCMYVCMQNAGFEPRGSLKPNLSRLNACWQTDWAIEDQAKKTWTRQPVPMISKHSAHLTPLPFGIRTWLWRYTYLLLFISMLWHRQAIFRIERRQVVFLCRMQDSNPGGLWNPIFSRLNACWKTDWAIEDQAKKTWTRQPVPICFYNHNSYLYTLYTPKNI